MKLDHNTNLYVPPVIAALEIRVDSVSLPTVRKQVYPLHEL